MKELKAKVERLAASLWGNVFVNRIRGTGNWRIVGVTDGKPVELVNPAPLEDLFKHLQEMKENQ